MDRLSAKRKALEDIREYASGHLATALKAKFRPAPPAPEPAAAEPAPEEDVDLSGLDDSAITALLGE